MDVERLVCSYQIDISSYEPSVIQLTIFKGFA